MECRNRARRHTPRDGAIRRNRNANRLAVMALVGNPARSGRVIRASGDLNRNAAGGATGADDDDGDEFPSHDRDLGKQRESAYTGSTRDALSACADDIKALWGDPTIQSMLTKKKVRLEEGPGL